MRANFVSIRRNSFAKLGFKMILRNHLYSLCVFIWPMMIVSGCSGFAPVSSSGDKTCSWPTSGSISETKTIVTPIAVIQATRAGAAWEVTVSTRYAHDASIQYNVLNGEGNAAKVLRFRADLPVTHEAVPVAGGLVLFAYARDGWSGSELRVTVLDEKNTIIHTEILK